MGVQICIEREVLEAAGWKCQVVNDVTYDIGEDGCEFEVDISFLNIKKDGYEFSSYFPDIFVADCNVWGSNRERFIQAGLFDLEHTEG